MATPLDMHEDEKLICELSPSQIINIKPFAIAFLGIAAAITAGILSGLGWVYALLVLPLFYGVWKWLQVRSRRLKLTTERIIMREGVLNKSTNETELYRVRDSTIEEPFFYRMFDCGNIHIFTTDEAGGKIKLQAFAKPHWIKDQIRNYSEICRQRKRWGADNVLLHDHGER